MSDTSLLYNTTPIHCTPLPLHPPVMNTHIPSCGSFWVGDNTTTNDNNNNNNNNNNTTRHPVVPSGQRPEDGLLIITILIHATIINNPIIIIIINTIIEKCLNGTQRPEDGPVVRPELLCFVLLSLLSLFTE